MQFTEISEYQPSLSYRASKSRFFPYIHCKFCRDCPTSKMTSATVKPSIILSGGARRRNYQISSAVRSYFPMFSPMLFLLVQKMETMFYSISFCPPNSPKSKTTHFILLIQFSWFLSQLRKLGMGRRQFHAGEEGQGGNFGNTRRDTGSR